MFLPIKFVKLCFPPTKNMRIFFPPQTCPSVWGGDLVSPTKILKTKTLPTMGFLEQRIPLINVQIVQS